MTHEERARIFSSKNDMDEPIDMVAILGVEITTRAMRKLAAAFAEVEQAAIKEARADGAVARAGVGQYNVTLKPPAGILMGETASLSPVLRSRKSMSAWVDELAPYDKLNIPKANPKSCTCGAQSVKSRQHSNWCDLYGGGQ